MDMALDEIPVSKQDLQTGSEDGEGANAEQRGRRRESNDVEDENGSNIEDADLGPTKKTPKTSHLTAEVQRRGKSNVERHGRDPADDVDVGGGPISRTAGVQR